ncbi:MAG: thioesterase domain-containing protein, partial [Segetibacter sp.]
TLVSHLKAKLPEYMIPFSWVEMDEIPVTKNGKIDKRSLPNPDLSQIAVKDYVAPRNEVEEKLAQIWKDLLGAERVGIHDDFFELGGHSLLAMRLISAIRKKLNIEVRVNDVFIFPTIAEFASHVETLSNESTNAPASIKTLVPLQITGDKTPLYIICGGGGTATRFKRFASLLDDDQPVYALQPPVDVEEVERFPANIQDIASQFIDEISIRNPNGPYALSGHCLGGIIAFEMARQLKAKGKKVHLLALFDTIIYRSQKLKPATLKNLYHIPLFIKKYGLRVYSKLHFETFLLRNHTRQAIRYKINKIKLISSKIRRKITSDNEEYFTLDIYDESSRVYQNAIKNYEFSRYGGNILLFYAKEHYAFLDRINNVRYGKRYLSDDLKNVWNEFAESVSIYEVEGEHSTIFDPAHAADFAQLLQKLLNDSSID